MSKECGSCKFFAQGKTCSYCENPKQTDSGFKGYVYYNFGCDLFEEGTSQTRIDWYNNLPKEDKDRFEAMKDWPNQQWYKDLIAYGKTIETKNIQKGLPIMDKIKNVFKNS